jgi:hypothetical protein
MEILLTVAVYRGSDNAVSRERAGEVENARQRRTGAPRGEGDA